MIEKLPELVNSDEALVRRGRWLTADALIEVGARGHLVRFEAGRIAAVRRLTTNLVPWSFAIRAEEEVWRRFWRPVPEPGYHDIIALMRYGRMRLEGNLQPLMAHLLYVKAVLETPRRLSAQPEARA
jgi:hypothetical protein